MKLAVCLITADRHAYTKRTVESFAEYNETDDMILLHADDGSELGWNRFLAQHYGFDTVYASQERRGVVPALRFMWNEAVARGATHILHLENDCVSVAPLPSPELAAASIRLYGAFKDTHGKYPTGRHHMGTKDPIEWRPIPIWEGWEEAVCHWGAQPSITAASLLVPAINKAKSLKDVSRALARIDTVRPVANITSHIGVEKTQNPVFKC